MKHYFIGIPIPSQVYAIAEKFKKDYSLHDTYKVLTHQDDLHVTLLYLGAVSEAQLQLVKSQLTEIAQNNSPFTLSINSLAYFGAKDGPRVVYLAVEENERLNKVQQEINDQITSLVGLPKTDRFVPHITIAKKRKTQEKTVIEKQPIQLIEVPVPSFTLFTIHPNKLPKYEAIEMYPLKNA